MSIFSAHVLINCPKSEVFAFVSDFDNDWKWRTNLFESYSNLSKIPADEPDMKHRIRLWGVQLNAQQEITLFQENVKIIRRIKSTLISIQENRIVENISSDKTNFSLTYQIKFTGIYKVIPSFVLREHRYYLRQSMEWLKKLLESSSEYLLKPKDKQPPKTTF
jgi:hypothetical protein